MEQIIAAKPPMGEGEQRGRNKIKTAAQEGKENTRNVKKRKKEQKKKKKSQKIKPGGCE